MTGAGLRQRLTAILAADVAGYARLMAADAGATMAALDETRTVFRREIEANRGRVVDMVAFKEPGCVNCTLRALLR